MKSSNKISFLPLLLSNLCIKMWQMLGDMLYPNAVKADCNSLVSIDPDLLVSNLLKHFCHSKMYFHKWTKVSKFTSLEGPWEGAKPSMMAFTVDNWKGKSSNPLVKADCNSVALISPFLFWSTLSKYDLSVVKSWVGGGGAGLFGVDIFLRKIFVLTFGVGNRLQMTSSAGALWVRINQNG